MDFLVFSLFCPNILHEVHRPGPPSLFDHMIEQHFDLAKPSNYGIIEKLSEIELELPLPIVYLAGVGVGFIPEPEGVGLGKLREGVLLALVIFDEGFVKFLDFAEPEDQHLLFSKGEIMHHHLVHHIVILFVVFKLDLVADVVVHGCVSFD